MGVLSQPSEVLLRGACIQFQQLTRTSVAGIAHTIQDSVSVAWVLLRIVLIIHSNVLSVKVAGVNFLSPASSSFWFWCNLQKIEFFITFKWKELSSGECGSICFHCRKNKATSTWIFMWNAKRIYSLQRPLTLLDLEGFVCWIQRWQWQLGMVRRLWLFLSRKDLTSLPGNLLLLFSR